MSKRITTMDHEEIKKWVSQRGGKPVIKEEQKSEGPITYLSIEFDKGEGAGKTKEELNWDRFFEIFENKMLAFQYEEEENNSNLRKDFKIVGRTL